MYVKRLLYNPYSDRLISIILGFGLATLFRKVCNDRNCLIFKAPPINKIHNKIFKYNNKCYSFSHNSIHCSKSKKIVDFA